MSVWNRGGIPHKGWKCIDVIDVAEFAWSNLKNFRNDHQW